MSSLEEKLLLSRYSNSPLDDIDADFSSISGRPCPRIGVCGVDVGPGRRRHRAARVRPARLAMVVKATNDCAAANSGTKTIEEKITSLVRLQRAFERQGPSTMNLCVRPVGHARVLRGLRSMWIATLRTSFLAPSPHRRMSVACQWARRDLALLSLLGGWRHFEWEKSAVST